MFASRALRCAESFRFAVSPAKMAFFAWLASFSAITPSTIPAVSAAAATPAAVHAGQVTDFGTGRSSVLSVPKTYGCCCCGAGGTLGLLRSGATFAATLSKTWIIFGLVRGGSSAAGSSLSASPNAWRAAGSSPSWK